MTMKKLVHAIAISAIAAGSTLPLAASANAAGRHHKGMHSSKSFKYSGKHWNGGHKGWKHGHKRHRGRGIALGAFATILGIAIASQAVRAHHHDEYDDYDY